MKDYGKEESSSKSKPVIPKIQGSKPVSSGAVSSGKAWHGFSEKKK